MEEAYFVILLASALVYLTWACIKANTKRRGDEPLDMLDHIAPYY